MKPKYAAFSALDPFFEVVQRGLSGLVDGEHYFDTMIAENAIFEFRYDIAGWPKRVESRDARLRNGENGPTRAREAGIPFIAGEGSPVQPSRRSRRRLASRRAARRARACGDQEANAAERPNGGAPEASTG